MIKPLYARTVAFSERNTSVSTWQMTTKGLKSAYFQRV